MLLIHWPGAAKTELSSPENAAKRIETWRVLEDYYSRGVARAIGVSNFDIKHLEHLLQHATIPPAVNQIECHPLWPQTELREFCRLHGVAVQAYSSFATGALLTDPELSEHVQKIAAQCNKTAAQLLLCWGLQKGCCSVLPKSVQEDRIKKYSTNAVGMQCDEGRWLSVEAEAALDALGEVGGGRRRKYCWDPSTVS